MADLSGSLASFGVRQVLELLAASGKTGELRFTSGTVVGRALFHDGQIAYATTATDTETAQELEALLGPDHRDVGDAPASLDTALREQITQVFFELAELDTGSFDFMESSRLPNPDDQAFSVTEVMADVDARIEEWRWIQKLIPATTEPYRMADHLPVDTAEVTIDSETWGLMSAARGGRSVQDVAVRLDLSEFQTAQKFAALVSAGLLEPVGGHRPPSPVDPVDEPEMPRVQPVTDAVTISKEDLSREEMDDMIRNIGRGIYPS